MQKHYDQAVEEAESRFDPVSSLKTLPKVQNVSLRWVEGLGCLPEDQVRMAGVQEPEFPLGRPT
jgi:hypothetical protein